MIQQFHFWEFTQRKQLIQKDTRTPRLIVALFVITKVWKQLKCPLIDKWIKMWCVYIIYICVCVYIYIPGVSGGSEVKPSARNVGDPGSIPGLGRSPGEGNGNPLQDSCLENPMEGGAW